MSMQLFRAAGRQCLLSAPREQVHRGVYEAAKQLYARFEPLLEEHLASSPFARAAFIGHSLGGSLGSLLMLMFLHRGVLPPTAVSPTYTFGAPAIFCEAAGPGGICALPPRGAPKALGDGGAGSSNSQVCGMSHAAHGSRVLLMRARGHARRAAARAPSLSVDVRDRRSSGEQCMHAPLVGGCSGAVCCAIMWGGCAL